MKKIVIALGIIIVLLLALLFIVPSLIPSEVYKDKIQSQLSTELGREVRIPGEVKLSTFPLIKASTGAVEIDNPEGFSRSDFASLEGLDARIKLWPLLSKRVEISKFTLKTPVIRLEKRADGAANWEFGDAPKPDAPEAGPFKRDGRMAALDPQLRAFNLENGTVTLTDAVAGKTLSVTDINTFVSLPGMAQTLVVDGSLNYDGMPITLDINLDSPRAFLDGKSAAVKGTVKTDFADVKVDGAFLPGEAIDFAGQLSGDISDISALKPFAGENAAYLSALQALAFSGDVRMEDGTYAVKQADLNISGDALQVTFAGDAQYDGTPAATGKLNANISDMAALKPFLPSGVKGLEHIKTASVSANLAAKDKGFNANDLIATASGPDLSATFKGKAAFTDILTAQGAADFDVKNPAKLAADFAPDIQAARALGPIKGSAQIALSDKDVRATELRVDTAGDNLTAGYNGNVSFVGGKAEAKGGFNANIPDAPALAQLAGLTIENIGAVRRVEVTGSVDYNEAATRLSGLDAKLLDGPLTGTYLGSVTMGKVPAYDGTFTANIAQLTALDQAVTMDIPYADAIGQVDVSGTVKGAGQAIGITGLVAELKDGLLNGSYKGSATYQDGLSLHGTLNTAIRSLRELAQKTGTELPPSTAAGEIFGPFSMSGKVTGTPEAIDLTGADITLDEITGKGTFGVSLKGAKSVIDGTLNLPSGLDLRPYMESYSAQRPEGAIQPWSEEPINAAGLRAVDAKLVTTTPNVITDRLALGQTTINTTLTNGVMTAVMPDLSLYGGKGTMTASLDASAAVPSIAIDAKLNELQTNDFLTAVAGFVNASGDGDTALTIRGQGLSQAAIMKSLSGDGGFKVLNGSLKGIDASKFMTGLDTALTSRQLPSGIGADQITQFQDIIGQFQIDNGVVKIGKFQMNALNILAEGEGEIDLGNQAIDFSFLPKLTGDQASGLAAFGVPIRFSGGFGSAKASLDTDFLGEILTARARAAASDKIKDEIGGTLGDVVGGIIGGNSNTGGGTPTTEPAETGSDSAPNQPVETQTPETAIEDALGGLLGIKKSTPPETAPAPEGAEAPKTETAEPEDPTVEDAILGIFGKKKPKAEETPPKEPAEDE